jgi:multicomponent Na+:H+ antiporter subunit A
MYLSGFLVKTALFGVYKFVLPIVDTLTTTIIVTWLMASLVDASMKMFGQTDLKKLVAYGTIQEMSLILFMLVFGTGSNIVYAITFVFSHAILSTIMFFIVDCVQRKYTFRSIYRLGSIAEITPMLSGCIIAMCLIFAGLPFSIKYIVEVNLLLALVSAEWYLAAIVVAVCNIAASIAFTYCWYVAVFGSPKGKMLAEDKNIPDLDRREKFVLGILFFILIVSMYGIPLII